jgi:hypothetical protein
MTTPGRLAAARRRGTQPDRETRIGLGLLAPPLPLVACGDLSPGGPRRERRGSSEDRWSH